MVTAIEKLYIDYVYKNMDNASMFSEIKPGIVLLRNTKVATLFSHPHVKLWHKFLLEIFDPKILGKKYALILPCSSVKPYRISRLHSQLESMLAKYSLADNIQRYIISEPMVLVPRELDIYYPFANYDYPPEELTEKDLEIFIELLSFVLPKLKTHRKIIAILPKHHSTILTSALKLCGNCITVEIYSYGKKAFKTVKNVVENLRNTIALHNF